MKCHLLVLLLLLTGQLHAQELNGFSLDDAAVSATDIHQGGPPRDGIPALDQPVTLPAAQADWLRDEDLVIGLVVNGAARAYPMRILVWHEIVNDTLGGTPVAVTFCPLCGSGVVFDRRMGKETLTFAVSGLLYNSDMLLYDRESESLWTQIPGEAISGAMKGRTLKRLPIMHTRWSAWRAQHPGTQVLSRQTGYQRDYDHYPYADYESAFTLHFPVSKRDRRYHPKELVIGFAKGRSAKVWPFAELMKSTAPVADIFAGSPVVVHYDDASQSAWIEDENGKLLPATTLFWFAWYAFYPHTEVYQP